MHSIRKAGIVCCSNALSPANRSDIDALCTLLMQHGIETQCSDLLYSDTAFCGSPQQRANALMQFYRDDSISDIFDVSGGDLANSILSYLDYDCITASNACFWGYSDLTTILNAIYAKTGKAGVLYQIRNLLSPMCCTGSELFHFPYRLIRGDQLNGIVIGGNIRCFLKLAGTPYMPDFSDKILLLEARSGTSAQMLTYLAQLQQLGAFDQISGILLGTFTQMQCEHHTPDIISLVQSFSHSLPIAVTPNIGHAVDSHAIYIGKSIHLTR